LPLSHSSGPCIGAFQCRQQQDQGHDEHGWRAQSKTASAHRYSGWVAAPQRMSRPVAFHQCRPSWGLRRSTWCIVATIAREETRGPTDWPPAEKTNGAGRAEIPPAGRRSPLKRVRDAIGIDKVGTVTHQPAGIDEIPRKIDRPESHGVPPAAQVGRAGPAGKDRLRPEDHLPSAPISTAAPSPTSTVSSEVPLPRAWCWPR
jgi:hypothetical protein